MIYQFFTELRAAQLCYKFYHTTRPDWTVHQPILGIHNGQKGWYVYYGVI